MKYITGQPRTDEENREQMNKIIQSYDNPNVSYLVMAIELKQEQTFIGTCAVILNEEVDYEIGYRFMEDYWNQGFGYEIVCHLIDYCFLHLPINSIVAQVALDNKASVRILEKVHMTRYKTDYVEDVHSMVGYYSLKKSEWLSL